MIRKKDKLTVVLSKETSEMARKAASDVARQILLLLESKETINMIFAAAPSQSEFFKALIDHGEIPWDRINAMHMDEYIGLEEEAPQRFGNFLKRELFELVDFRRVFYIDGNNEEEEECRRYSSIIKQYPPDIICLGIGENGHIAFNDPHEAKFNDTEIIKPVSLDEICRKQQVDDNCFRRIQEVPERALTLTIPTLLSGKYLFCIVPYKNKAAAVWKTLNGPISESCPASVLRTREDTILYLDKDSSAFIEIDT